MPRCPRCQLAHNNPLYIALDRHRDHDDQHIPVRSDSNGVLQSNFLARAPVGVKFWRAKLRQGVPFSGHRQCECVTFYATLPASGVLVRCIARSCAAKGDFPAQKASAQIRGHATGSTFPHAASFASRAELHSSPRAPHSACFPARCRRNPIPTATVRLRSDGQRFHVSRPLQGCVGRISRPHALHPATGDRKVYDDHHARPLCRSHAHKNQPCDRPDALLSAVPVLPMTGTPPRLACPAMPKLAESSSPARIT